MIYVTPSCMSPPPADREFANKSAASAASRDYEKFQAVIKSAASAASPRPNQEIKSGNPRSGERPEPSPESDPSPGRPRRPTEPRRPGAPLELPSLDFAFGEAAPAADLITA